MAAGFGLLAAVCGGWAGGGCLLRPATACCRDVSSVEVLMNYHQGLKTELEARVPELTACQELGRSLLLNKSAMADEVGSGAGGSPLLSVPPGVGAILDASPTYPTTPRSRHSWTSWEPGRRKCQTSGTAIGSGCSRVSGAQTHVAQGHRDLLRVSRKAQRVAGACLAHVHSSPVADMKAWQGGQGGCLVALWWQVFGGEAVLSDVGQPHSFRAQRGAGWPRGSQGAWTGREDSHCP